jgi:signal transduction histidine kinase
MAWRWIQANTLTPSWLPARWRHSATPYILVLLVQVAAAILTRLLLGTFTSFLFPDAVELLVVALAALSFGAAPALFATLVGLGLEELVVLPVLVGEGHIDFSDLLEIGVFLAVGISLAMAASATEHSRRRAVQERVEAQARALRASLRLQQRMDEFLAIASHDLRSPVTTTLGFIEVAAKRCQRLAVTARGEKSDLTRQMDNVQDSLDAALQSAERLSRLVTLLFDVSQVRAGKLELHPAGCDLAALVEDEVVAVRMAAPERTIRLDVSDDEPALVTADADRIGQVITNYLTNALKYSPATEPVDVRVTLAGDRARVAVADHGPGLPADELEHVWEPFRRLSSVAAQSNASGGLGMGLHICKTLVELHGGQVGVESEMGRGSTFWFTLPRSRPTA